MTEEEAKTKWCPTARTHDGDRIASVNRKYDGGPDIGAQCLGSGCMAWRWDTNIQINGYCGLAGKP